MPKRIQRKRVKGWRMPDNAVSVARPSLYGNQFKVGEHGNAAECVELFRDLWESNIDMLFDELEKLRGKDLACFCPLDQPCHADVLIEMANRPNTKEDSSSGNAAE